MLEHRDPSCLSPNAVAVGPPRDETQTSNRSFLQWNFRVKSRVVHGIGLCRFGGLIPRKGSCRGTSEVEKGDGGSMRPVGEEGDRASRA